MSKDVETTKGEATAGASARDDDALTTLRRLHREYVAAVWELAAEGDRRVAAALESCMGDLTKIEDDVSSSLRKASDEHEAALRAGEGASQQRWALQRKLTDASADAEQRADAARKQYLEAWRAAETSLDELTEKARRDYLARVSDVARALDLGRLDAAAVAGLVAALGAAFGDACAAPGGGFEAVTA